MMMRSGVDAVVYGRMTIDVRARLGFGSHRPKGPHLHFGDQEVPYAFTTLDQLVEDFWDLVRKAGFAP